MINNWLNAADNQADHIKLLKIAGITPDPDRVYAGIESVAKPMTLKQQQFRKIVDSIKILLNGYNRVIPNLYVLHDEGRSYSMSDWEVNLPQSFQLIPVGYSGDVYKIEVKDLGFKVATLLYDGTEWRLAEKLSVINTYHKAMNNMVYLLNEGGLQ